MKLLDIHGYRTYCTPHFVEIFGVAFTLRFSFFVNVDVKKAMFDMFLCKTELTPPSSTTTRKEAEKAFFLFGMCFSLKWITYRGVQKNEGEKLRKCRDS